MFLCCADNLIFLGLQVLHFHSCWLCPEHRRLLEHRVLVNVHNATFVLSPQGDKTTHIGFLCNPDNTALGIKTLRKNYVPKCWTPIALYGTNCLHWDAKECLSTHMKHIKPFVWHSNMGWQLQVYMASQSNISWWKATHTQNVHVKHLMELWRLR